MFAAHSLFYYIQHIFICLLLTVIEFVLHPDLAAKHSAQRDIGIQEGFVQLTFVPMPADIQQFGRLKELILTRFMDPDRCDKIFFGRTPSKPVSTIDFSRSWLRLQLYPIAEVSAIFAKF